MQKPTNGKISPECKAIHKFYGYLKNYMKYCLFILSSLLSGQFFAQNNDAAFQVLYSSPVVSISAEKNLYETDNSPHFFIHYQIKNIGAYDLAFYLEDEDRLFYPNQWGIVDTTMRLIVSERRIIVHNMGDTTKRWMKRLYGKGELHKLKPGATIDYYRNFNNGSKNDIQFKEGEYMYISMDGELFYLQDKHINDTEFEYQISCAHFGSEKFTKESTVYLSYPISFKKIPTNAIIFQ